MASQFAVHRSLIVQLAAQQRWLRSFACFVMGQLFFCETDLGNNSYW
jgi:hypothetical protein